MGMVERVSGNLLDADVQALVNTVNTVGVMGKGIALQFKKAYPENYRAYKKACDAGQVQPGQMLTYDLGGLQNPRYIINFPTKRHWRGGSKIEDIESGLVALIKEVERLKIESIALPPLGCGSGGLDWNRVSVLIEQAFADLPAVRVLLFEPAGAPPAEKMRNRTARPKMTKGRAVILRLMDRYFVPGYEYPLSVLEAQKLAYFLQEAGEPLKLNFQEGLYGPYADELRHVMNHLEGHFIRGFGDGSNDPQKEVQLLPGAAEEAESFLKIHPEIQSRFARVAELIEGFETPFGMELLSSVHWVAAHKDATAKTDAEAAFSGVQNWSQRKADLFKWGHVLAAWQRLRELGWL
jgi:O-acetyl-ADP-ribose deacetylase (regulator of RNase III)